MNSKTSTPINQLPNASQQDNVFVNDQQKQYIAQAQQAISKSPMPQSSGDIINDDDMIVQDILNQINNDAVSKSATIPPSIPMIPQQMPNWNPLMQQQQMGIQSQMGPQPQIQATVQHISSLPFNHLKLFADDLQLAGIVFFAVIIAHFIPLCSFIGKYISLDKVPYHNIIINAIAASLLVVAVKVFFIKKN